MVYSSIYSKIQSREDLANLFIEQLKYNIEITPDGEELQLKSILRQSF